MCSIIGYKGKNAAAPILVDSLKRMEYRGYDSVGVATFDSGSILVRKGTGKVLEVNRNLNIDQMAARSGSDTRAGQRTAAGQTRMPTPILPARTISRLFTTGLSKITGS